MCVWQAPETLPTYYRQWIPKKWGDKSSLQLPSSSASPIRQHHLLRHGVSSCGPVVELAGHQRLEAASGRCRMELGWALAPATLPPMVPLAISFQWSTLR